MTHLKITRLLILTIGLSLMGCSNGKNEKPVTIGRVNPEFFQNSGKIDIKYDGAIHFNCTFFINKNKAPMVMIKDSFHPKKFESKEIKGNFLFDTGAMGLTFDNLFYNNSGFNYEYVEPFDITGVGEGATHGRRIGETVNFSFGSFPYVSYSNTIGDFKTIFGKDYDGVIGHIFFENKIMELNFKKSFVRFINPKEFNPVGYTKLSFSIKDYMLINAEIQISESVKIKGDFLFDTGFLGCISLTSETVQKYKLDSVIKKKTEYESVNQGFGKKQKGFGCKLEGIKIGDFEINNLGMICSRDASGAAAKGNYLGMIGNGVFERFDMIIDFPNKLLYLKPNEDFRTSYVFNKYGFASTDRTDICDGRIVKGIFKGCNADLAGLRIGDTITHMNNRSVKLISDKERRKIYDGDNVELTIRRNKKIIKMNIELKDVMLEL